MNKLPYWVLYYSVWAKADGDIVLENVASMVNAQSEMTAMALIRLQLSKDGYGGGYRVVFHDVHIVKPDENLFD